MGNSPSAPLNPKPAALNYFALIFRYPDRIMLVYAEPNVQEVILRAIQNSYQEGIYEHGPYYGQGYRYKLCGSPFMKGGGFEQSIAMKNMCNTILSDLYAAGYVLDVCSDLSRFADLTTWFFRKSAVEQPAKSICCVSLSSHDRLQIIGSNANTEAAVVKAIANGYPPGGTTERRGQGYVEFIMNATPWFADSETAVAARRFLAEVVRQFELIQFKFYGTVNLKGTADSLFFIHSPEDAPPPGESRYFAISLNRGDRLRLIGAPQQLEELTGAFLQRRWAYGVQKIQEYCGAWECKLAGEPWCARDAEESVACRMLLCELFAEYLKAGWAVHCSLDVSRSLTDKSVFILRSFGQGITMAHACISMNSTDCIRLLNFQQGFAEVFATALQAWPFGVTRMTPNFIMGSTEFQLSGYPWGSCARGGDGFHCRALMCGVLKFLEDSGWKVMSSADVSAKFVHQENGPDYPLDVHSWFAVYVGPRQR